MSVHVALKHDPRNAGLGTIIMVSPTLDQCVMAVTRDLLKEVKDEHYNPAARFLNLSGGVSQQLWSDQWNEDTGVLEYTVETWDDGTRVSKLYSLFDEYFKIMIIKGKLTADQVQRELCDWREQAAGAGDASAFMPMFTPIRRVLTFTGMKDDWIATHGSTAPHSHTHNPTCSCKLPGN